MTMTTGADVDNVFDYVSVFKPSFPSILSSPSCVYITGVFFFFFTYFSSANCAR